MVRTKKANAFALRLPLTTRTDAATLASLQGVSLNEFIINAVAEKIERLEHPLETWPLGKPPHRERRSAPKDRPDQKHTAGHA